VFGPRLARYCFVLLLDLVSVSVCTLCYQGLVECCFLITYANVSGQAMQDCSKEIFLSMGENEV
jgi:hypothetical protein